MELIRGLHNIKDKHQGCVLTIGKFDGVHLGHHAVLKQVIAKAKQLGLPATVMVFEPQPEEVFTPDIAPARLSRLRDKYVDLKRLGVDRLLCINFSQNFANCSADEFIDNLLVKRLGVKFLVVGDDFRFGRGRKGDFTMLHAHGVEHGFEVVSTQSFRLEDCRISSTAVRQALDASDFELTEQMLGKPFAVSGKVVHGDKKGRTIGFPTANVLLKRCKAPVNGVFAVKVLLDGQEKPLGGVANIGTRPTVNGQRSQLEVHIFNFEQDLYGKFIQVQLHKKLRDEQRFDSFEHLKEQIQRDAQQARTWLSDRVVSH